MVNEPALIRLFIPLESNAPMMPKGNLRTIPCEACLDDKYEGVCVGGGGGRRRRRIWRKIREMMKTTTVTTITTTARIR